MDKKMENREQSLYGLLARTSSSCRQLTSKIQTSSGTNMDLRHTTMANETNIQIIQRFQNKVLPIIMDCPCYDSNLYAIAHNFPAQQVR